VKEGTRVVEERVHAFLDQQVQPGGRLIVAVSGGPDSVALLHLVTTWARTKQVVAHVFHMDHGLRGEESAEDARFVRELAAKWNLPCTVVGLAPGELERMGGSTQAAARTRRYEELLRLAHRIGAGSIATGHNQDDQAETVLMRFLRGAGSHGLAGIPPVAIREGVRIIRPLLTVSRREIEAYCNAHGLIFRTDSTNLGTDYLRNRLRHHLLPELAAQYNPAISRLLAQTADLMRAEDEWLDEQATAALARCRVEDQSLTGAPSQSGEGKEAPHVEHLTLDAARLADEPLPLARRLVRLAARALGAGEGEISLATCERVLALTANRGGTQRVPLGPGLWVAAEYGRLRFYREEGLGEGPVGEWPLPLGGRFTIPELGVTLEIRTGPAPESSGQQLVAAFDAALLPGPLSIRSRRPGDRLWPVGMVGSKKLQDILVDAKVPRRLRNRVPVLTAGDEVLWVLPYRLDRRFLATIDTVEKIWVVAIFEAQGS
jgi:tRNA(Ile)-lysidine synthase